MKKTSNIHIRVDAELKKKAVKVLDSLGISITQFIELSLRQLIENRSIRFELKSIKDNKKKH